MKRFRSIGQRVRIVLGGFELDGRTGTVTRKRRADNGAWVDIDDGLPESLRSFDKDDEGRRGNHIILYPEDCEEA